MESKLFYSPEFHVREVVPSNILNITNECILTEKEINKFKFLSRSCCLFFIDLEPEANWAHQCIYVFFNGKKTYSKYFQSGFPPK